MLPNGSFHRASQREFVFGSSYRGHVRVLFNTGLNQSSIVREAFLYLDHELPTMQLGDVRPEVALDRVAAVIWHEFGHVLGLRHEDQHPLGGIKWNKEVVIAYYTKFLGWTADKVKEFVFDVYGDSSYMCIIAPQFDT